jgi:hypothetical protein
MSRRLPSCEGRAVVAAPAEAFVFRSRRPAFGEDDISTGRSTMKHRNLSALSILAGLGLSLLAPGTATAVMYCQYIDYPAGCVVRPGVVLVPRPVARAVVTPRVGAPGVGVRPGTPMNRGGPVNRAGRR